MGALAFFACPNAKQVCQLQLVAVVRNVVVLMIQQPSILETKMFTQSS